MNVREKILRNTEMVLSRITYELAYPENTFPYSNERQESLCKCAEHMSMVIWNISNSEESYDELTDEEVEEGIL